MYVFLTLGHFLFGSGMIIKQTLFRDDLVPFCEEQKVNIFLCLARTKEDAVPCREKGNFGS